MLQMRSYRETPKKCLSSSNYMKKMTQLCPFAWVQSTDQVDHFLVDVHNHGSILNEVALPLTKHLRIQLVFSSHLIQGRLLTQKFQHHFGFKFGCVMISFFHTLILAYFFPISVSLPGSSIVCSSRFDADGSIN